MTVKYGEVWQQLKKFWSLSKWLDEGLERHEVGDKHIMFKLAADVFSDLGEGETAENAFEN